MKWLVFSLFLATRLGAQSFEAGLNVSRQTYTSTTAPSGLAFEYSPKTVVSGRLGYTLVDLGPAMFQVSAVYQPKVETDLKPNGVTVPTKLSSEYWGVGAMFNFKALVAFGAGLDCRFEKSTHTNVFTSSNTFVRPWARINAGYAIPSPVLKPFIGLEVAAPLTKDTNGPNFQAGVYAGLRF